MHRPSPILILVVTAALLAAPGCSSTREIRADAPRPAPGLNDAAGAPRTGTAGLRFVFESAPALPRDVDAMQLRISRLGIHERGGDWLQWTPDVSIVLAEGRQPVPRELLTVRTEPAFFDSLEIAFSDLVVRYGPNAGGPIDVPEEPLRMAVRLTAEADAERILRLRFDPAASLTEADSCRRVFDPVVRFGP